MNSNKYYNPFEFLNVNNVNHDRISAEKVINDNKTQHAYLVRKDNNEEIIINKSCFVIGKNNSCNYVISGNNAVSRQHAEIELKNNSVYIKDKKSTNKTFVNGKELVPDELVKIVSGDEIKIANVRFALIIK